MKIHILLQNQEKGNFESLCTLDLLAVPSIGSKVNLKMPTDSQSLIYEVIDVCFGDGQLCEIYVKCLCTQTDYHLRKF